MDIREIRIDQFGCWQDVVVNSLPLGMNVIHLDDGGQPVEFSRFLHGVLFGFEKGRKLSAGGALVFADADEMVSVDRQISSRDKARLRVKRDGRVVENSDRAVRQLQALMEPMLASRVFVPASDVRPQEHWQWLAKQPNLTGKLVKASPKQSPPLREIADPNLAAELENDAHSLTVESNRLRERIETLQTQLAATQVQKTKASAAKFSDAELDDELRMLRHRLEPLEFAVSLADQWRECRSLHSPKPDLAQLKRWRGVFAKYKNAEQQKESIHQTLLKGRKRRSGSSRSEEISGTSRPSKQRIAVQRLLRQRPWIERTIEHTDQAISSPISSLDAGLRHAAELTIAAKRDADRSEASWERFITETGFDWSDHSTANVMMRREIDENSPLAAAPLTQQLEELKRRRLWIMQEYQCLRSRQTLSSQVRLWIAILFVLSIASLFGTLVVVSHFSQFVLLSLGLAGMASSGATKMALEKRVARLLGKTRDRLSHLDQEITSVTERMWDEEKANGLAAAREQQHNHATTLRDQIVESNRRLESAEIAFREALVSNAFSPSLSPADVLQLNSPEPKWKTNEMPRSSSPSRLERWKKAARKLIHHIDGECHDVRATALLDQLERIESRWAHRSSVTTPTKNTVTSTPVADVRRLKAELQRLEKIQRKLLKREKMHDVFELESAIEKALNHKKRYARWQRLNRDLKLRIDTHEDGGDARELLEMYDQEELLRRIAAIDAHRKELEELRSQQTRRSMVQPISQDDVQQELLATQDAHADVEVRLKAVSQARLRLKESLPVVESTPSPQPSRLQQQLQELLLQLTAGEFDTLNFEGGHFSLCSTQFDRTIPLESKSDEAAVAWLAVRVLLARELQASRGQTLAMVVLVDELFATKYAMQVYRTLANLVDEGQQVLMLAASQTTVNQLVDAGVSAVRIGLRESLGLSKQTRVPEMVGRAA